MLYLLTHLFLPPLAPLLQVILVVFAQSIYFHLLMLHIAGNENLLPKKIKRLKNKSEIGVSEYYKIGLGKI